MNKNISSEEKLLKLIRAKKPRPDSSPKGADKEDRAAKWARWALLFWKWGAVIFLVGGAGTLLLVFNKYHMTKARAPEMDAAAQPLDNRAGAALAEAPGLDYKYIIQERDIFAAAPEQKKDSGEPVASKPAITERYKLVGIMLDNNPTVIIEDLQTHQTAILSKGQKINEVTLEDIRADRVILMDGEEKVELLR